MCRDVMWRSEDSFVDSVLFLHHVALGDLTGRLSSKHLYPQSDLFLLLSALFHCALLLERAPSLCRCFRAS